MHIVGSILLTDRIYFKIQVENLLADVSIEMYVKIPISTLVNTY